MEPANGAAMLQPVRDLGPEPPSLCRVGPCRHYHRLVTQMPAMDPMDVATHGRTFHVAIDHVCYPQTGIEIELGSTPILDCNRWVPVGFLRRRGKLRREFQADLDAFKGELAPPADVEIDTVSAPLRIEYMIRAEVVLEDDTKRVDTKLWSLVADATALDLAAGAAEILGSRAPAGLLSDYGVAVRAAGELSPITNLSASIVLLGYRPGQFFTVTFRKQESKS